MLTHILRELILPPSSLLMLFVAAWLLRKRKPGWGRGLFILTCAVLYLLSIPLVSLWLTRTTETVPALSLDQMRGFAPQAIVVLGGGAKYNSPEFQGRTVPSASTLQRVYYAAYLAKQLNLPVITSGGYGATPEDAEGYVAAGYLTEAGVKEVIMETKSTNTRENALFAREIARTRGLDRVLVVTDATHAARAQMNFRAVGFQALAAPTAFRTRMPWERGVLMVIPSHSQFDDSGRALRAHLAYLWDWMRS